MPTYEYACSSCGNAWEEIQKITEAALEVCPKCGKSTAKRQISGGNFILKGGGWYADLYSSSKKGSGSSESSSSSSSSEKKSETKSETKETKTETKTESSASKPSGSAAAA